MNRTITLTRRVTIAVAALAIVAVAVSGALLSNYLVPSTVNVTSQPGITVFTCDTTPAPTTTPATTFALGDVQQGQAKMFAVVSIKNSQGSTTMFINAASLTTTAPLPSGLSLSWNLASLPGYNPTTAAVQIAPTQQTGCIQLTFTASTSATPGSLSFTVQFDAFSTVSG